MAILRNNRVQFLLFMVGLVVLSITADKCRQMVGEESTSKSGKFTFMACFDGGSGSVACAVKEGVKLYFNNIRALHVETKRNEAIQSALADAVTQGISANEAAKIAQKEGEKAAKLAKRKAQRIIGPIIASGWDFFEAIYYGGSVTEGFLRGTGTLFGTYAVGFAGEQRLGRFGYLVGSQLGSWVGGRIGLMVYDVVNGIHFMIQFVQGESQLNEDSSNKEFFGSTNSYESSNYETPTYENVDAHEEF